MTYKKLNYTKGLRTESEVKKVFAETRNIRATARKLNVSPSLVKLYLQPHHDFIFLAESRRLTKFVRQLQSRNLKEKIIRDIAEFTDRISGEAKQRFLLKLIANGANDLESLISESGFSSDEVKYILSCLLNQKKIRSVQKWRTRKFEYFIEENFADKNQN